MAGMVMQLVPRRTFDFTHLIPGAPSTKLVVAERIDVSQYNDGVLEIRVHDSTFGGNLVSFELREDGFYDEDPGLIFEGAVIANKLLNEVKPQYIPIYTPLRGTFVRLVLTAFKSGGTTFTGTFSVDLVARSADAM
jgi:hypothetical protein